MTKLHDILEAAVSDGPLPGAVALIARGDDIDVQVVGSVDADGSAPMTRDSIFRVASITKPMTAAAVMMLVDDGQIALDDPVVRWLPELAEPMVVRTPDAPVDDVLPASRPITVFDLLTFRAGWGFPADFSQPAVGPLFSDLKQGVQQHRVAPPDVWMATLARVPMLTQPGSTWLYNTCADILGVLIARASGSSLPDFLAERIFEPLGMVDTGFAVPDAKMDRFTSMYNLDPDGAPHLVDPPKGDWSHVPVFPSAAGGLVSTLDDWYAFARMLLAAGAVGGRQLLSPSSVQQMTTNHLTADQRAASELFLEGQGWGFGGSVDVAPTEAWNVPGRYGWVGGTGTAAHIVPATGTVTILLSQLMMAGPTPTTLMRDFWRCAAA